MEKASKFSLNSQIVCVGDFNPAIVTPDWLAGKGLINSDDLDICRDTIQAHGKSKIMVFQSKWFRLQILAQQLSIASLDGATPRISDLIAGILTLLPDTPVNAFGINFDSHFKMHDVESYHRFGDYFAPKTAFLKAVPQIEGKSTSAGLLHLTVAIEGNSRTNSADKTKVTTQKRITIEPSNSISPGIFFLYNHHILVSNIKSDDSASDAIAVAEFVQANWSENLTDSTRIFNDLIESALG